MVPEFLVREGSGGGGLRLGWDERGRVTGVTPGGLSVLNSLVGGARCPWTGVRVCRADLLPAPGTGLPRYLLEGVGWGVLGGPRAFQTRPCLVCVCTKGLRARPGVARLLMSPTRLAGCVVMC